MTSTSGPAAGDTLASRLRAKLRSGVPVVGAMVGTPSADVVEMLGLAGFDFVTIDIEHEPLDDSAVMTMIRAADSRGLPVVVRGPMSHRLGTLLNFGAAGVQVPDVRSVDELRRIVDLVRFPPRGARPGTHLSRVVGYGAPGAHGAGDDPADDPVVIAMIEDVHVAKDVDQLLACDGVDAFYVGPYDLRASMGPGTTTAEVREVADEVVRRCVAAAMPVAVGVVSAAETADGVVGTVADVAARREQGIGLFVVAVSMFLAQQLTRHRRELAEALASGAH